MSPLLTSISLVTFIFIMDVTCNLQPPILNPTVSVPTKTLGDCQGCKLLVESFKRGLERTARGKFEGGDAAWEEEKLKSYQRSEVRLVELQEGLCKDVKNHEIQCYTIAEKAEEHIEHWWFNHQGTDDIFYFLCIDKLKHCCPDNHFGKDCLPCLSDCNGNGKCKGNGTRKGNGKCACDAGYSGQDCEKCASGYYVSYKDDDKLLCSPCHVSCINECTQSGPKGCTVCATGWVMDTEEGCVDVNECEDVNKCGKNNFCVNKEGGHVCMSCDKSCNGCYGDGPDVCHRCAKGYSKKGELCIADREEEKEGDTLTSTRYLTYIGLLIATGILLPKSTTLGAAVGTMVLSYIVGAEYYCMLNGHSHGLLDLKNFDLSQLFRS